MPVFEPRKTQSGIAFLASRGKLVNVPLDEQAAAANTSTAIGALFLYLADVVLQGRPCGGRLLASGPRDGLKHRWSKASMV
jgi:hypothetical protein